MPLYACGLPPHMSAISSPSRPRMIRAKGASVTWKPVANTIVSTSCSTPSRLTMPLGTTSAMPSVTTSTFGCVIAGYHSLEGRTRLHPKE